MAKSKQRIIFLFFRYFIYTEVSEDKKGLGFADGTQRKASRLVEDDVMSLTCYVAIYLCEADDVQIYKDNQVWNKQTPDVTWDM